MGGRPDRGNPRVHLRLDPRVLYGLEIVARRQGLTVHQVIYAIIEGYLARVGGVAPQPPMSEELLNRVTVTRLKAILSQLRFELDMSDIATVKEKRLTDLDKAVQDLVRMAERSKSIEQRIRVSQALGYLCLTIDGFLNGQKDAIDQAVTEMEKKLELLETGSTPSR